MEKEMFVWTEGDSVGVQLFDEQHKVFFHIANNILDLLRSDMGESAKRNTLISLLRYLKGYTTFHLDSEEKYFSQFHYEDAAAHIATHNEFRETIDTFMLNAEQESSDLEKIGKEMAEFAGKWLLVHIRVVDKEYSNFFHEHGMH